MTVDTHGALARVAASEGSVDEAKERCRTILSLWEESDDHHYAIGGIRWGAAFFAAEGEREGLHACVDALTRIASATGHADALAALAHALAETALMEGDPETAAEQLSRAVELHRGLDLPFAGAEIEYRAGVALAAAGERELALERLQDSYRAARKLGARPLALNAAREVAALGGSVAGRLGRRAADRWRAPGCRRASARSCGCSPRGGPTGRSRRTSSSARARSTCTCATSCASSTAAHASRRPAALASSA